VAHHRRGEIESHQAATGRIPFDDPAEIHRELGTVDRAREQDQGADLAGAAEAAIEEWGESRENSYHPRAPMPTPGEPLFVGDAKHRQPGAECDALRRRRCRCARRDETHDHRRRT
jgi:hypothetical protein